MFELGKSLLWPSFVHPMFQALKPYKSLKLLCAFSSLWCPLSEYICGGGGGHLGPAAQETCAGKETRGVGGQS